jgi:hypothetical protein
MPQLEININIGNLTDGSQQVYLTQANKLSVKLTNQTGGPLTLTGGQPQNPPPQGGATGLLLDFSQLYKSPGDQKDLTITATGWMAKFFPDPDFPAWVVSPDNSLTLNNDDALFFTVSNLTPTTGTGSYYVSLDLYNAGGQYKSTYTAPMMVSNPPSTSKNLLDYMGMEVIVNPVQVRDGKNQQINYVGITKVASEPYVNEIQLTLYNKSAVFPIVPSWGPDPPLPQFTVSFVPANESPGFFALSTPDAINDFSFDVSAATKGWQYSRLPGSPARWSLSPLPSNQNILGTSPDTSIARFKIGNVRTSFINGPTLMYLQYANIPGYNDGFMAFLLNKEYATMNIESFYVTPDTLNITDYNPQTVALNWKVNNSTFVEISGVGKVDSSGSAFSVPAITNQTFVLTAYDMITGVLQTRTAKLTVSPPISNRWTRVGSIMIWSGSIADKPPGWFFCDGNNGTPELRDCFILGAGGSRSPGQADRFPKHTHALAGFKVTAHLSQVGNHQHAVPNAWYNRGLSCGKWAGIDTLTTVKQNVEPAGSHAHDLYVDFSNVRSGENNEALRPNWYALCFIMMGNP